MKNFFLSEYMEIVAGRTAMINELRIWGYDESEIQVYLKAFDYFVVNPEDFDGATLTEDLEDIPGLDLDAMLHDYLYVGLNASASLKYMWLADKLIRSEMRRRCKSTWNTGYRFVMLVLKTPFFLLYCYLVKGRRCTVYDKARLDNNFRVLFRKQKIWYREFQNEMIWFLIFFFSITYFIFKISQIF